MITRPNQELIAEKLTKLFEEYPELITVMCARQNHQPNRVIIDCNSLDDDGKYEQFDMMMEFKIEEKADDSVA